MTAFDFILLLEDLEDEGWELTREDWSWLASHADYQEAYSEWNANHGDARDEALTSWERNR